MYLAPLPFAACLRAGMGHDPRAAAGEDQSERAGHAHHHRREIMSHTGPLQVGWIRRSATHPASAGRWGRV